MHKNNTTYALRVIILNPEVLIVGAGPTGLILALTLSKYNIPFRIIDKNQGPGQFSRAMVIHARTLEIYRQLGISEEIIDLGIKVSNINWWKSSSKRANLKLTNIKKQITLYPFLLSLGQDEHEHFLVNKLMSQGIKIGWNTELVSFESNRDKLNVTLRYGTKLQECNVAYLAGCDGAHSKIRKEMGASFLGGKYEQDFYVADLSGGLVSSSDNSDNSLVTRDIISFDVFICDDGFLGMFPIKSTNMLRLIGMLPKELINVTNLKFEDVLPFIQKITKLNVNKVNWFSVYQVHHRVADFFSKDRVFILGDAAHIHSPAGGQGMNTGIGDAFNLAWKLAAVIKGKHSEDLLDTYEEERLPFARLLVDTTDKAFKALISTNILGSFIRKIVFPKILPVALKFAAVRRAFFMVLSQIRINYRKCTLSIGKSGKISSGDRLPWIKCNLYDNYLPLCSLDWQVHIYGKLNAQLRAYANSVSISFHQFVWNNTCRDAGLKEDKVYVIRPDGYIGLICSNNNLSGLREYIDNITLLHSNNKT